MSALALLVSLTLAALAAAHVSWGFGVVWPAADARALARAVAGAPGVRRMPPPAACFIVGALLAGLALVPFIAGGMLASGLPRWVERGFAAAVMAVFLARGAAPYVAAWRRRFPEEPFASLDRRIYGPLCLAIAAGLLVLLFSGAAP